MESTTTDDGEQRVAGSGSRSPGWPTVVLSLTVPIVIIGNALLVLLIPWHADIQYAVPGFPDSPIEFEQGERTELGRQGIVSIWPAGPGVGLLEEARLDGGGSAFTIDEIDHMADVRAVIRAFGIAWLVAVLVSVVALRASDRAGIRRGLKTGALLTLGLFLVVGLAALVSFDTFFTSFHELFFEDGTWTFPTESTLIALYPERFWTTATGALVLLSIIQAIALLWWAMRSRMPRWKK